jgi:hypothetical protein
MKKLFFVFVVVLTCLPVVAHAVNNCTGATYYDSDTDTCIACPVGYDYNTSAGKTSVTQCQIHCDAGTYVPAVVEYTQLTYIESDGNQYIKTNFVPSSDFKHTVVFEATASGSLQYVAGTSASYGRAGSVQINGYLRGILGNNASDEATNLIKTSLTSGVSVVNNKTTLVLDLHNNATNSILLNGVQVANTTKAKITSTAALRLFGITTSNASSIKLYSDTIEQNGIVVHNYVPARRDADSVLGLYDTVTGVFLTNSGSGTFGAGANVGNIGRHCTNAGEGYYSAAQTVNYGSAGTRTACPVGTTTVGYGHGADSANDCGRTLHVGNNVLYMRKNKETSPSMGIDMGGGDVYYISLSSSNHNLSPVHLWHNGGKYTAYDDSLLYNERDLTTNTQITP